MMAILIVSHFGTWHKLGTPNYVYYCVRDSLELPCSFEAVCASVVNIQAVFNGSHFSTRPFWYLALTCNPEA